MSTAQESFRLTHDLIAHFLKSNGYLETLDTFYKEGGDFCVITQADAHHLPKGGIPLLECVSETYSRRQEIENQITGKGLDEIPTLDEKELSVDSIKLINTFENIHYANILSVITAKLPTLNQGETIFITSSTDKSIKLSDFKSGKVIDKIDEPNLGGSTLSLSINPIQPNLLLSSSMDHSISLHDLENNCLLNRWTLHTKFVNQIGFSPDGEFFFSISYDHQLILFSNSNMDKNNINNYEVVKKLIYKNRIESACWTLDSQYIIFSVRDDNYLHYLNRSTLEITNYNMNKNGDDFISFTAINITLHPLGQHILITTDHRSGRLILMQLHTSYQARNYYQPIQTDLPNLKTCFHPSGRYFWLTTENFELALFHIDHPIPQGFINAHKGIIRNIYFDTRENALISVSFDKSVKVWMIKD